MSIEERATNDELRGDLEKGLLKSDLSDLAHIGEDALELGLDSLLDEGILKDTPVVGVVAKLYYAGSKLYSYKVQKNILHFFQEYSLGEIDDIRRQEFLDRFQEDRKYRQSVLDTILISLAHYSDAIQARVLANLIKAHIEKSIDFNQLRACEFALNKLNPIAYKYLEVLSESNVPFIANRPQGDDEALLFSGGIAYRYGNQLRVSSIGRDLFNYGIKPLRLQN